MLPRYNERLEIEIDLIITMGFIGYFLVVSDFIQWANRKIFLSGLAEVLLLDHWLHGHYKLPILIRLNIILLFERFLNPERITMPDIDIDFCIEGRERLSNMCVINMDMIKCARL